MRKKGLGIILLASTLFILTIFIGYSVKNNSKVTFGIEEFKSEMKAKNYNFEITDGQQVFLPNGSKRMVIGSEAIDIYIFSNNEEMENEASHIDSDGSEYNNGYSSTNVSWVSHPHFYKKGSIIVLYIGVNEKIISNLKDILGEQFAGR